MKIKAIKINRFIPLLLCAVLCVLWLFGQSLTLASADSSTSKYTDVMADLSKDPKFNPGDYSAKDDDYSVHVIQIAESTAKELFIYTYQPSGNAHNIKADYISISTSSDPDNPKWQLYPLHFINREGLFYKYVVNDLKVETKLARTYNISEILRPWSYDFDGESPTDNDLASVPYTVSQEWIAVTVDGKVAYAFTETQTILVTEMWCGTLSFDDGAGHKTDRHFVAFDTDHDIDKLLSADVRFKYRTCSITSVWTGSKQEWSSKKEKTVTVNYDEKGSNLDEGWLAGKYEWKRISTVEDFKKEKDTKLSEDAKEKLKGKKWVLNYYETDRKSGVNFIDIAFTGYYSHTKISEVAILRLKFDMGGKVYNLGAVSNIQSPDDIIDGENLSFWDKVGRWFEDNWYWLVIGIVGIVLLIVIMPFMPTILSAVVSFLRLLLKGLWWLIKHLCIALWWIISAPFRLIKWIIDKIRERKAVSAS